MNKRNLKQFISELEEHSGGNTELVSVYVPPSKNINDIVNHLNSEEAEAGNIKSKSTRNNVQSALSSLSSEARSYDRVPDNGMVLFSGVVDDNKLTFVLDDLPSKVSSFRYYCDSEFLLDPLREMVTSNEMYGLICLDLNASRLGFLKGSSIIEKWYYEPMIHSKHSAGGQSQARFERVREKQINNYFNQVSDACLNVFYDDRHNINGFIIGGTSHTVDKFLNSDKLHHEIQENIIGKVSVSNVEERGLEELVNNASNILEEAEYQKYEDIMSEFLSGLRDGNSEYGFNQVVKMLEYGAVDTLILSESISGEVSKYSKDINSEKDVVSFLSEKAKNTGADVVFIPSDFEKGEQFEESLTGIGAILRYNPNE